MLAGLHFTWGFWFFDVVFRVFMRWIPPDTSELRWWWCCTWQPSCYSTCDPGLIHYALCIVMPPTPLFKLPPPCWKLRLSPAPCRLHQGFYRSCRYWYAINRRITPAFPWKCQPISAKWVHVDDSGGYTVTIPQNFCLRVNYNWNLQWKRGSASDLVNWGLIIFTL